MAAGLRPGNTHASKGALTVLKRLTKKLRQAYPKALLLVRSDAGLAVPAPYEYLEGQPEVRYVIGFIINARFLALAAPFLEKAQRQYQEAGAKPRLFTSSSYQAESWDRPRRLIAKVEYGPLGPKGRFVVAHLVRHPRFGYDDL